ncbi:MULTISPECIES: FbpB family small basic protein [Oceanobacillus]|uniref:FbpB family small basic protein n=1 Tax=Oceanobacillus locisalsi TaxID=546107 RepID=A0ABW3NHF7_9BACI|nr:FbpB family small basic protein [Oceanobacillus timonensis]
MRPRSLNFEQLVDMNRQELLNDEKSISQIEEKLEKKQEAFFLNHKKNEELTAE